MIDLSRRNLYPGDQVRANYSAAGIVTYWSG